LPILTNPQGWRQGNLPHTSTTITESKAQIENRFGLTRGVLLAVGVACLMLGLVTAWLLSSGRKAGTERPE
jgi:hypothetical protein